MAGVPLALAFGVPVGTFVGDLIGWRSTFAVMGALAILVSAWTIWKLPTFSGEPAGERLPLRSVLMRPGLIAILTAAFAFEVAHMNLYTYVSPFLARARLGGHVALAAMARHAFPPPQRSGAQSSNDARRTRAATRGSADRQALPSGP